MNISVEYKDATGRTSNQVYNMPWLGFIKHLAVAGQGYSPQPAKLFRMLGMTLHYSNYMRIRAFNSNRFSEPPVGLSDPTEKGQFSNLAGKAIADFLSKRIDNSLYTVNYEAAMRLKNMPLSKGGKQIRRPDLIAFTTNSMFAIEAKGFSNGYGDMNKHKTQSATGGIPVNYTIASVAYDLYSGIKCKYHDPYNDNVQFDNRLLSELTKKYYKGLAEFLDLKMVDYREATFLDEEFYEIELSSQYFARFIKTPRFAWYWYDEIFHFYRPTLILPRDIKKYAETGITNEISPFLFYPKEQSNENIYIDNDRVGLRLR